MKEEEIRPAKIFDEYLRLAKEDVDIYFKDSPVFEINCPACQTKGKMFFKKDGFTYETCPECATLFVNPRPHAQAFNRYYKESASSKYWATTFYKTTEEARREKLWKPKAKLVESIVARHGSKQDFKIYDIGAGYGIFAEEFMRLTGRTVIAIEPAEHLAQVCQKKGLTVIQKFLEEIEITDLCSQSKVFVSFEMFEHLHDPSFFLEMLFKLMQTGDLFLFTTLSGFGADICALGASSKSVSPPHHLNFFNPGSVSRLLKSSGFDVKEVTTPGKLDVDIICNNKELIKDAFWKTFAKYADEKQKQIMQSALVDSLFSSHMMVVAQKP